jgi:hypothetical protein
MEDGMSHKEIPDVFDSYGSLFQIVKVAVGKTGVFFLPIQVNGVGDHFVECNVLKDQVLP